MNKKETLIYSHCVRLLTFTICINKLNANFTGLLHLRTDISVCLVNLAHIVFKYTTQPTGIFVFEILRFRSVRAVFA